MATVSRSPLDSLRNWHSLEDHPVWASSFASSEQEDLVRDDLSAGFSVAGVLVAVVALGLLLIAGSVMIILS
jgi:hypothetical protein